MLLEIFISNFILIDTIRLPFQSGLTVLSGETGAGKSIVIDALGLVLGDRAQKDLVRDAMRRAIAEASFDIGGLPHLQMMLIEQGLLEEGETILVLSREIVPEGKNLARLNGRIVTASQLREISSLLLDMHLQHDHLSILKPQMYLQYLDNFVAESDSLLQKVGKLYRLLAQNKAELAELQRAQQSILERYDYLCHQIQEIEGAQLQSGEEEALTQARQRMRDAERLVVGTQRLIQLLYEQDRGGSAYDLISEALQTVSTLEDDPFFGSLKRPLTDISFVLEEIAGSLSAYKYTIDEAPRSLDEIESRLDLIQRLKSRYGQNITEILNYLSEAKSESGRLQDDQSRQEALTRKIKELHEEYRRAAMQLSSARKKAALKLEEQIHRELIELNLPHLVFKVNVKEGEAASTGINQVELLFSANPGEELRPVQRIASGGEISRFVLALKIVLAGVYQVPTLVFDEIDAGVGGRSLTAMAQKIADLAKHYQVLTVTHAPHIASVSQQHYLISKEIKEERSVTKVVALNEAERIREIARMLAGDDASPVTLEHARQIYLKGQQYTRKN